MNSRRSFLKFFCIAPAIAAAPAISEAMNALAQDNEYDDDVGPEEEGYDMCYTIASPADLGRTKENSRRFMDYVCGIKAAR